MASKSVRVLRWGVNKKHTTEWLCVFYGTPKENRTPDSAVRGQRLNRLTMRASNLLNYNSIIILFLQENFILF